MSEWRQIDSAPQDGTPILVLVEDTFKTYTVVAKWAPNFHSNGNYRRMGWMMPGYQGIAHDAVSPIPAMWHPLPALPK